MRTAHDLAELVVQVRPLRGAPGRAGRLHPATQTFQALRMAVNRELEGIPPLLESAVGALAVGGRIAVVAFHSGEDAVVKHALRDLAGRCTCPPSLLRCECGRMKRVRILTRRPLRPGQEEYARNPRARSARLRAAEKMPGA